MKAQTKSLTSRALNGISWVLFETGSQVVVKLIVIMVLARLLTPDDFGLIALAVLVGTFVQLFCKMGVSSAVVRLPDLGRNQIGAAYAVSGTLALAGAAAVALSAPVIASFFERPELAQLLLGIALLPLMIGLTQVSEGSLLRDLQFKSISLINGCGFVFGYGLISISSAMLGFGAWSVILGMLADELIRTILLLARKWERPSFAFGRGEVGELLKFGGGLSAVQLTNSVAYQVDNFVVGKFLGVEALGFYSRAYQVVTVPTRLLGTTALRVLFPAMSSVQFDTEKLVNAVSRALGGVALLAFPASMFLCIMAPELVYLILGGQWDRVIVPFQILSLAISFRVGHKVLDSLVRAKGALGKLWLCQATYAVLVAVFAYVGHFYGLPGVSIGILVATTISFLMLLFIANMLLGQAAFALLHQVRRHLIFTFVWAMPLLSLALATRHWELAWFEVLASCSIWAAATFVGAFWCFPKLLGPDAEYFARAFSDRIAKRKLTR